MNGMMKTLDLHGIRHDDVDRQVENFIFLEERPVKIITGKSQKMQSIAKDVLERNDFSYHYENYANTGAIIVE